MTKIYFTFDKTIKSQKLKKLLLCQYKNTPVKNAEIIVVAGGDGYMLKTIKKYILYKIPFYGINCGSFGFLMNQYDSKNLERKIKNAKKTIINPLYISSSNKKHKKNLIAVNEVSIFRQSRQTAYFSHQ
jgi:NAD+ kinase